MRRCSSGPTMSRPAGRWCSPSSMPGRARPPRTSPITRPAPMVRPPPMSCWGAMVTPGTLSSADAASCLRSMVSGFRRLDGPVLVDAFNDVDRPALHLEEETPEIFADDAERQELDGEYLGRLFLE